MDLNLRRPALRRLSLPAELPSTVRSWPKVSLRERCFVSPKSTIGLPRTQSSGRAAQSVLALETPASLCFVSRPESGVLLSHMPLDLAKPDCFGLRGMKERAVSLGGSVAITGGPGRGTTITLTLPVADPAPGDDGDRQ
mgnify:CR=1 FL=1